MTKTIFSSLWRKTLQIIGEFTRGGQGIIWETDDPRILVKQFEPSFITDDPGEQRELARMVERVYKAFCAVNKGTQAELRCLPREFVTHRGNPAYLMERAEGELLQSMLRQNKITTDNRLPIARALARAMRLLHASQIVHADVNPENFIARQDHTGWTVFVLDIDGGGLVSPPGPIYPLSQPKRLYKAPELFAMQWQQLWQRHVFFAPDDWALAVLLYQLLVDYEGPFCTVQTHPDPTVKNYVPYKPSAYRDTAIAWPAPWQKKLLRRARLSPRIVSLFSETFGNRFALVEHKETILSHRPAAAQWEATFSRASSVPRWVPHVVCDVYSAVAGAVRSHHLKRGVSSNERSATPAAA
jgi:serine/threonine protein kinase